MQYKIHGEGPALVLVPGGLTGWLSWDAFIPEFNTNKIIQVQLLNVQYGLENKLLPDSYSVKLESHALAASLIEAGINEPADFIGWSYGGLILLDFALNNPALIKTLTLIEPPAFWILNAHGVHNENAEKVTTTLSRFENDISENDLEVFLTSVGFAKPGTSIKDHPNWKNWLPFRYSLRQNKVVPQHTDDIEKLQNFKPAVLLVKGTGSASFFHAAIDIMDKDFPRAIVI